MSSIKPNRPAAESNSAKKSSDVIQQQVMIAIQEESEKCTSAKKSSGLKCIAKQVIDIMKENAYASYQQVASIVVQLNLKSPG